MTRALVGNGVDNEKSWTRGGYFLSTAQHRLELDLIRDFLSDSYWAKGIPLPTVEAACRNSLCFGLYEQAEESLAAQVGFARVITDYTTFAYLADVFVLETHQGSGLAKWMMGCIMAHPDLLGLRRWMLATRDAHSLYERYGFTPLGDPRKFMEIARPGLYHQAQDPISRASEEKLR